MGFPKHTNLEEPMPDPETAVGPRWPETLKLASENTALSLELRRACANAVDSLTAWAKLDRQVYDLTEQLSRVKHSLAATDKAFAGEQHRYMELSARFERAEIRLHNLQHDNASLEKELALQRGVFSPAQGDKAAQLVRKIKAEMSCRVEHGAKDEGGHLSAMLGLIARWEKAMGVEP